MIRIVKRTFQTFHKQLITTLQTKLQVCGTILVSAYSPEILVDTPHIQTKQKKNNNKSCTYSKEAIAAHEHKSDTRGWPNK
jgi:hypothetical protein